MAQKETLLKQECKEEDTEIEGKTMNISFSLLDFRVSFG